MRTAKKPGLRHAVAVADASESRRSYVLPIALVLLLALGGGTCFLAWKKNDDRHVCIMKQKVIQQAARSYEGVNGLLIGAPVDWSQIRGSYLSEESFRCPCGGDYDLSSAVPAPGTLHAPCKRAEHEPPAHGDW